MKMIFPVVLAVLVMLATMGASPARSEDSREFETELSGSQEIPPRDTKAEGEAKFKFSRGGTGLAFKLKVSHIRNVFAAHIHCGAKGVNGPVGVTLFMGTPGSGRVNGVLARGTITAPDPGNACGWVTLADVATAMRSGNTYVNVHTNDGIAPTNTGPGDFPGGEIRGQIDD
jgi:hypothetical protein